jgi:hypothetical protein
MSIGKLPPPWLPEEEGRSGSSNAWEAGSYRPRDEEADADGGEGGASELGEGDRRGDVAAAAAHPAGNRRVQPEIAVVR